MMASTGEQVKLLATHVAVPLADLRSACGGLMMMKDAVTLAQVKLEPVSAMMSKTKTKKALQEGKMKKRKARNDVKFSQADVAEIADKITKLKRLKSAASCDSIHAQEAHMRKIIRQTLLDHGSSDNITSELKIHLDESRVKSNLEEISELTKSLAKVPKFAYDKAAATLGELQLESARDIKFEKLQIRKATLTKQQRERRAAAKQVKLEEE
jgi:hypothetical protein